jgi:hypothetical protein
MGLTANEEEKLEIVANYQGIAWWEGREADKLPSFLF